MISIHQWKLCVYLLTVCFLGDLDLDLDRDLDVRLTFFGETDRDLDLPRLETGF